MTLYRSSNRPIIAKEIHDKFIAPFIYYMSQGSWYYMSAGKLLDIFFHADQRKIYDAIAHTNFRMPGKYVTHGCNAIEGIYRHVEAGTRLVLRRDVTIDRVDVEIIQDVSKSVKPYSEVFYLTQSQYKYILTKIKFVKAKYR